MVLGKLVFYNGKIIDFYVYSAILIFFILYTYIHYT